MSDRERWIVYPLLLLALGTSLRMKMVGTEQLRVHRELDAELIRCRQLILYNQEGQALLALSSTDDGKYGVIDSQRGALRINGPVLAKSVVSEEIGVIGREGQRVMTLNAVYAMSDGELQGGALTVFDEKKKPHLVLGESPVGGIVTAFDDNGKVVIIGHVQPQPGVHLAGMFTVANDGTTIKPLGTKYDPSVEKEQEPKGKKQKSDNEAKAHSEKADR